MFEAVIEEIRESVYAVVTCTENYRGRKCSAGTGFIINPEIIVTASHNLHEDGNCGNPRYQTIEVIRAPNIGENFTRARLIAEDTIRDLALLEIKNPDSESQVTFVQEKVPIGIITGSLGFPMAKVNFHDSGKSVELPLRFQSAFISSFNSEDRDGNVLDFYETDKTMHDGSSGCPGFLVNGGIFGIQVEKRDEFPFSLWVPSIDVIRFADDNGVKVKTE